MGASVQRIGTPETCGDTMEHEPLKKVEINGVDYYLATEVARSVGVSRQTLWRWRNAGYIPKGQRLRRRQVLFSAAEVVAIRQYANLLEPADITARQAQGSR